MTLPRVLLFLLAHHRHPLALLFGKATIRIIVHPQLSLLPLSAPSLCVLRSRPFLLRRSRSRSRATLQLSVPRDVLEREHHVFDFGSQSVQSLAQAFTPQRLLRVGEVRLQGLGEILGRRRVSMPPCRQPQAS